MSVSSRITTGLFVVSALVLAGCGSSAATPDKATPGTATPMQVYNVNFGVVPGAAVSLAYFTANRMGFFEKNGINPTPVSFGSGAQAVQLLASKQVDFSGSEMVGLINAKQAGADVVFDFATNTRPNFTLQCSKDSGISGSFPSVMKQLEGKTVGVTAIGNASDYLTEWSLFKAGAAPEKVKLVAGGSLANVAAALEAKQVDCGVLAEPFTSQLQSSTNMIIDFAKGTGPSDFNPYPITVISSPKSYADANPAAVKAVAKAFSEAIAYLQDPANFKTIAEKVAPDFPGASQTQILGYIQGNAPTAGYKITPTAFATALDIFNTLKLGKSSASYSYKSFIADATYDSNQGDEAKTK